MPEGANVAYAPKRDVGLALAALLIASAIVFALPLGRRPLDNQDEARYSLLAREAVEHGNWILPRVRDEVYLNKPPLLRIVNINALRQPWPPAWPPAP